MLPDATSDLYQTQQRRIFSLLLLLRREWAKLDESLAWPSIASTVTALTSAAMVGAARDGSAAVAPALAQVGFVVPPIAPVVPEAFGETASDGRDLQDLLYGSIVRVKTAQEPTFEERLEVGGRWLEMAAHTQVADAARGASSVEIAVRPKIGWIRMVNTPCCKRCAVLAGKWFGWNDGFERHPNCDCVHRPAHEDEPPSGYAAVIGPEDVKDLTQAEQAAIADGADFNQVVNASRRGSRNGMTTSEGTTRRGMYGGGYSTGSRPDIATATKVGRRGAVENYTVRRTRERLTPEAIYRVSATRDEAVSRLRDNGYVL